LSAECFHSLLGYSNTFKRLARYTRSILPYPQITQSTLISFEIDSQFLEK
jgi:hypothetical protein